MLCCPTTHFLVSFSIDGSCKKLTVGEKDLYLAFLGVGLLFTRLVTLVLYSTPVGKLLFFPSDSTCNCRELNVS